MVESVRREWSLSKPVPVHLCRKQESSRTETTSAVLDRTPYILNSLANQTRCAKETKANGAELILIEKTGDVETRQS
jgi:hypothetical protein